MTESMRIYIYLGYVWIDGIERNGAEWNIMEWSGAEWNETQIPFHRLDIQWWNGTKLPLHHLESERNGISYNIFIPILSLFEKTLNCK
jgi:hypothetical protein